MVIEIWFVRADQRAIGRSKAQDKRTRFVEGQSGFLCFYQFGNRIVGG